MEFLTTTPILPESGEYAMIAMRYKDTELAFCMKPEDMDDGLIQTIETLRKLVLDQS
jgi:hypothetical protein